MLAPSFVVKQTAKTALSGKGVISVAVSCVFVFTILICDVLTGLLSQVAGTVAATLFYVAVMIFLCLPLFFGVVAYFRRILWGQTDNVISIFKYFSDKQSYRRVLRLIITLTLRLLGYGIVLYIPYISVNILASDWVYELIGIPIPIWASNLWVLSSFLGLAAGVILFFVALKYYMTPFLFIACDDIDTEEAINMSVIISRRTASDFFWLAVSFGGWIILSLFLAPLIFTLPYFLCSYCLHCRYAVTAYNKDVDRLNSDNTPHFEVGI